MAVFVEGRRADSRIGVVAGVLVGAAIWAFCARGEADRAPERLELEAGAPIGDRVRDASGGERFWPAAAPRRIEVERAAAIEPAPYVAPGPEIVRWVGDLASDHVRFNGRRAPSDLLLEVSVEGLGRGAHISRGFDRAAASARFLRDHVGRVWPWLVRGLGSGDDQQRFLCAFLIAQSGSDAWIGRTAPILIEHLGDNRIGGDAVMSAHALYRLGRPALPFVRAAMARADRQALSLLRLIELDIEHPPRNRDQTWRRRRMQSVTRVYADPVVQFDLNRSRVPTW